MKIQPINANLATAAYYYIMISSFVSTLLPRSSSSRSSTITAVTAFRHASITTTTTTTTPVSLRLPCYSSRGEYQIRKYNDVNCARSMMASSLSSMHNSKKYGPLSTRLYQSEDASNNNNNDNDNDETTDGAIITSIDNDDDDGNASSSSSSSSSNIIKTDDSQSNPRARWSRRKERKKMEKTLREQVAQTGDTTNLDPNGGLDWESFDFSMSPKTDVRFAEGDDGATNNPTGIPDHVMNTISTDSITYKSYLQNEANLDDRTSNRSLKQQSELTSLSPALVQKSIDVLSPFVQPKRIARIEQVLNSRTRHTRFLFENPSNPSNVWACLRTLDSFGIQYVDVIVHSDSYAGKAAVNQKRGMRTAMGSAMWMTVRQFGSLEGAVRCLKEEEGCLIYASDLNPNAKDVRDLTWDVDFDANDDDGDDDGGGGGGDDGKEQRPICIVMGNEDRGISDEMRELADETFYLPMCGFAESFNLSVATAITLAYMSAVSGRGDDGGGADGGATATAGDSDVGSRVEGPLRPGDLDPHELQCLKLKGVLNSIAQRRVGKAVLKKEGIVLPDSLFN